MMLAKNIEKGIVLFSNNMLPNLKWIKFFYLESHKSSKQVEGNDKSQEKLAFQTNILHYTSIPLVIHTTIQLFREIYAVYLIT